MDFPVDFYSDRMLTLLLSLALCVAEPHPARFDDLTPHLRTSYHDADTWTSVRERIDRHTQSRIEAGEEEAMVYYLLQGRDFTRRPPIEPEAAAAANRVPEGRIRDLLTAIKHPQSGDRLSWARQRLNVPNPEQRLRTAVSVAFQQLREKSGAKADGQALSHWYQRRGISTDTTLTASYAVSVALRSIAARDPSWRVTRALILGPGLDWAPRGSWREEPIGSPQPWAVASTLHQLGLANRRLTVAAADVHPRVAAWFSQSHPAPPFRPDADVTDVDVNTWQREIKSWWGRDVQICGVRWNAVTQKIQAEPFDLAIATNVLLYLTDEEAALALANLAAVVRHGGYLLHNEMRGSLERVATAGGWNVVEARTIRIDLKSGAPAQEGAVILRRQ